MFANSFSVLTHLIQQPTPTPRTIPPPTNPINLNLLIIFGVAIVLIILAGLWLNRRRIEHS
jgi:LPXTG-motif cell wall-anchored protein